jgi:hypothetical protein
MCTENDACIAADDSNYKISYFCVLHFSLSDSNKASKAKNARPLNKIINEAEYLKQEIKVKEMWKDATAEVVMQMFEFEKEEQRAARLSKAPAIIPRSITASLKRAAAAQTTASSTAIDSEAPTYSWRRGALADDMKGNIECYRSAIKKSVA